MAQLQQHQARTQAATLLGQRLMPLLGGIQQQLGPSGGQDCQLQHLLSSLSQLSEMLQAEPQGADTQALQLLQWLEQSGALGTTAAAAAAALQPAPAPPAPGPGDSEALQALLRRLAGLQQQDEAGV